MNTGPLRFARYAYPPNALGYCGPADHAALLGAAGAADLAELAHLATRFEGAWPYLQLIAGCNGIEDPLDERVVDAYWVGNELLFGVGATALVSSLDERFSYRAGRGFDGIGNAAVLSGLPHHSFHVFCVYPWLGLLRSGTEGPALFVLDRCRVRWGRVESLTDETAVVLSSSLAFDHDRLGLGPLRQEEVRRYDSGASVDELRPGDVVSLHWDWICERLSRHRLGQLRACTRRNLAAANSLVKPGPALAADTWGG